MQNNTALSGRTRHRDHSMIRLIVHSDVLPRKCDNFSQKNNIQIRHIISPRYTVLSDEDHCDYILYVYENARDLDCHVYI